MFNLEDHKLNTAVITDRGERLSYKELAATANSFAKAVTQKGLLFCLCENRLGSLVGYVASIEHNIPIVLLDGGKGSSTLQNLIGIYQPEYVWGNAEKTKGYQGMAAV